MALISPSFYFISVSVDYILFSSYPELLLYELED